MKNISDIPEKRGHIGWGIAPGGVTTASTFLLNWWKLSTSIRLEIIFFARFLMEFYQQELSVHSLPIFSALKNFFPG